MRIGTVDEAASILLPLFSEAREERVAALHLSGDRHLLGVTLEQVGGRDEVELPVSAILASALKLGAAAFIVAHNHPSGDAAPSEMDKAATRRLADAARSVGMRFVDHLVFAEGEARSMAALGLM